MTIRSKILKAAGLASLWVLVSGSASFESLFAPDAELWPRWEKHDTSSTAVIDHQPWSGFLAERRSIGPDGVAKVDYAGTTDAEKTALKEYISGLANTPISTFNRSEQFAYWVNLYNALTVSVVLDNYPTASIRDIDISPGWLSDGPWDAKLLTIEGEEVSLNDIEHRILRPIWQDPRVHYVVNCASIGCPNLPEQALTSENTEAVLNAAARAYVNHPRGVTVSGSSATISSIYAWFQEDFGNSKPSVLRHLLTFAEPELKATLSNVDVYELDYAYDWDLNAATP